VSAVGQTRRGEANNSRAVACVREDRPRFPRPVCDKANCLKRCLTGSIIDSNKTQRGGII
jgi:hypothetical protein